MINFHMGIFWQGLEFLYQDIRRTSFVVASGHGNDRIPHNEIVTLRNNADYIIKECAVKLAPLETNPACIDLENILSLPEAMITYQDVLDRLEKLRSSIEYWAKQEYFYHYPREMAKLVHASSIENQWKEILAAFPSCRRDIETGIDCFALQDYSGCIFHMMGLAEAGLRAIARERGIRSIGAKPLEWAMWQQVFQKIEDELKTIRSKTAGPKKDAALAFYDTALSDLRRLQGYRDPGLHFRASYNRREAEDAMHRARSLLQMLATKLNEAKVRKIRWGVLTPSLVP